MSTLVTESDRETARGLAALFGGNGLSQNQQVELVAKKLAEIRTRTPRQAGRAAFFAGRPLNHNPHTPSTLAHQQWAAGHVSAEIDTPPHVLSYERGLAAIGAEVSGECGAWVLDYPTPMGRANAELQAFDYDVALAEAWTLVYSR